LGTAILADNSTMKLRLSDLGDGEYENFWRRNLEIWELYDMIK
jgi:hypothetical protein